MNPGWINSVYESVFIVALNDVCDIAYTISLSNQILNVLK